MGFRLAVDRGAAASREVVGEVWVEVVRVPRHVPQWVQVMGDSVRLFLHEPASSEPGQAAAPHFTPYLKGVP
jgi:hypothetical protein